MRRSAATHRDAIILITDGADPSLGNEGYQLSATPDDVIIAASHSAGLFYGTQTLRQLLPKEIESANVVTGVSWTVPGVAVWDTPKYAERGLMLDAGRQMESIDFVKRTVDRMAYQKLNMLHWHLTDDEGWRVEIKRYPALTAPAASASTAPTYYTQQELRNIVAYAEARYVTIVPEIEMPAHDHGVVAAYPELGTVAVATNPNGSWTDDPLDPSKDAVYTFLDNVLTEVMSIFPSKIIHIGGDELDPTVWQSSPGCLAFMQNHGLANTAALKDYFTNRISLFVQAHGRRIEKWTDKSDGGNVPADEVAEEWNNPPTALADAARGNDVIIADDGELYFDYGRDTPSMQTVYGVDPLKLLGTSAAGEHAHVLGVEACVWASFLPTDNALDAYIWPRIIALANDAWSGPGAAEDWPNFKTAMLTSFYPRIALMGTGVPDTSASVLHDLIAWSSFDWGVQVGGWDSKTVIPGDMTQTYNVTSLLHGSGWYIARARYESGPSGYWIEEADLLKNGLSVAQDKHEGWAGAVSRLTTYDLTGINYDPSAHYSLQVHYKTNNNDTNTNGSIWLQGPQ